VSTGFAAHGARVRLPGRLQCCSSGAGRPKLALAARRGHQTAHAALLTDVLDIMHGSSVSLGENLAPLASELSPSELRVLRYLPTNLSRPEIASELSISLHTVNTHVRKIYAKLGAEDGSAAVSRPITLANCGSSQPAAHTSEYASRDRVV
jgi:ATP/maltotriose-dependent transcriptional regulator MalT